MERFWKYFLLLCWIFYVILASLSIFLNGFLLNREVLTDRALCKSISGQVARDNVLEALQTQQICTSSKGRVILMIIDALMYDFTLHNDSLGSNPLPYQNKMPIFTELLNSKPAHSQLYKFIADPPTTTMQRLKGLTTGSLPTFIDAGSNFASSEIDEDNFLDQLRSTNGSIVFMGDDTWNSLYPERFLRQFPFPSFNVWDLDTVDRGVERNLRPQMKKRDWDLLIAHFLGVDHCGHRHGPNHPEMSRKLTEMDSIIRQIVKALDNDTMLIVIGDHGMTATGNHGGDSVAEITAAMFVYSVRPLFGSLGQSSGSVNQVDLVPTLATILGSPVPFSSLGSLIVETLPATKNWRESFLAVVSNVNQVHTYIKTYARTVSQFTDDSIATLDREYKNLQRLSTTVKTLDDFKSYVVESRKYLSKVKAMCEEIWVKFDLPQMFTGLVLIMLMIIINLIVIQTIPSQKIFAILESKILCYIAIAIFVFSLFGWFLFGIFLECSCSLSIIASASLIYKNYNDVRNGLKAQGKHSDWLNFIASLFILGNILGMFSNSYVVEESSVVSFWLVTLVAAVLFSWKRETGKPSKGQTTWLPFSVEKFVAIILAMVFCIAVRSLQYYWQCREEQTWCQNLPNLASTISKSGSVFKEVTFFPLVSIAIPVVAVWMWLRKCGNLVELTVTITTIKIVPILITIFISVYWVLEALPLKVLTKMVPWNIQLIPQLVYMLIVITLLCLVIQPLCVHVVPARRQSLQLEGEMNIVPHIFHHIKNALSEEKSKNKKSIPAVYGLPTVFSATLLVTGLFVLQLLCLLQGSKFAPALVIMFFSSLLLLGILAVYRIHKVVLAPQLLYVPWYAVTAWGLLAVTTFYGTGHQTTFPGIHWQAAFVGTSGEFSSQLIPGLIVSASTFSAQVWLGMLLPLLLVCPFTLLATCPRVGTKQDVRRGAANGEVFLYENSTLAEHSAFLLCVKYILFFALRVCGAMAAALLHRRHLMVWKVFAPKLIFESAGLAVSMVAVLLGFLLLSLLTRRLHLLLDRLQEGQE